MELEKCFRILIHLQKSASIPQRTSPDNFAGRVDLAGPTIWTRVFLPEKRYRLVRIRDSAEEIALTGGAGAEQQTSFDLLRRVRPLGGYSSFKLSILG